jgi:hypothetical protein
VSSGRKKKGDGETGETSDVDEDALLIGSLWEYRLFSNDFLYTYQLYSVFLDVFFACF